MTVRRRRARPHLTAHIALAAVVACGALASCSTKGGTTGQRRPSSATTSSSSTSLDSSRLPPGDIAGDVYAHTRPIDMSPAVKGIRPRVYVPNSESASVDVIDPATFQIIDHFDVGQNPQHITPSWDLHTLYVDNDLSNSLTPLDPATGKRSGADIPVTDPYNLYFTPDASKAIVVAEARRRLDFRDPHTWQLIKSVPIARKGADHVDFSEDGHYLLVSCEFSGYVVKVDLDKLEVAGEIKVGGSPVDVKLSPDGKVFYVANQERNGVSIIDGDKMKELAFLPTGKGAHGLYPDRSHQRLFVSNRLNGSVSVIDFATRHVTATWAIGGSPDMGGVSIDGKQLWLSGRYDKAVYVIDTTTGALLHTIAVGIGPHGLAYFPQPGRYSLGHTGVYR